MSKQRIATRLRELSQEAQSIAVDMDYYGGFSEWVQHSKELTNAAYTLLQWAGEIEDEIEGE